MRKHSAFVCIEGLDASGKTTQTKLLIESLRKKGFDAVYTTEPSRGRVGKLIRKYILTGQNRLSIILEALLFAADRIDHLEKEVKTVLQNKRIIVSDRYLYSSLAYQGAAGLDLKWIEEINKYALKPDLTIYIDMPSEIVLQRLKRKKSVMETLQNQQKVRKIYLELVETHGLRLINGNKSKAKVAQEILDVVTIFLSELDE